MEWAKARISGNYPQGSRGGYTTSWTPLQAIGSPRAYQRTGALGRGWRIVNEPNKTAYRLVNSVPYVKYVNADAYGNGQAEIHRGRWFKAFDVLKTAVDTVLRQYLNTDLRTVIRNAGFRDGGAAGL